MLAKEFTASQFKLEARDDVMITAHPSCQHIGERSDLSAGWAKQFFEKAQHR